MTLQQLKKKHRNKWVLAKVLKQDEQLQPISLRTIKHSKNREEIYNALLKVKPGAHVATFYTGKIPAKGYAVAF